VRVKLLALIKRDYAMLSVRLLLVATKFDIEEHAHEITKVGRAIQRPFKPAMHSRRSIAFVIETEETSEQLVKRMRPVLNNDRFLNFWAFTPGSDIAGRDGVNDPLATYVIGAHARVRQRNQSKNVRKRKSWERPVEGYVKNSKSGAAVAVSFKGRRKRKPPHKPNRP
jgi:hypothetical protein